MKRGLYDIIIVVVVYAIALVEEMVVPSNLPFFWLLWYKCGCAWYYTLLELDPLWLRWIWANNALRGYKASFLLWKTQGSFGSMCTSLLRGERESYRGGRMRLGEIEFAIIPSVERLLELDYILWWYSYPRKAFFFHLLSRSQAAAGCYFNGYVIVS